MRQADINTRMKLLLSNLGYTQSELATVTGITECNISHYINGVREPSVKQLIKIADRTHVSPAWILGYGPDEPMQKV